MTLPERIARFIAAEGLLTPAAKVIVGLSGGADSSALLAILCRLGYECVAVHCHFGLRGPEADRDLEHSRALAARLGAAGFREVRFDTRAYMRANGVSAEMACRDLRYGFFEELRREAGAEAVAVGHHREDNVETFFLNLLRGSGIHGLRAMLPKRGNIVRPLLMTPKAELLDYLKSEGIGYVTDSTNASNSFRRNRLRNVILPALDREFPGATGAIARSIELLRRNEELYDSMLPGRVDSLEGVTATLLHEWLAPYGFNSDQCARIIEAVSGASFASPSHRLTVCPGRKYSLAPIDRLPERPHLVGEIIGRPENFRPEAGVLYMDADAPGPQPAWELRPWRPGDRMVPFGMTGSRPVSDLLADAGIPADRRTESYVLTLDGRIVWAVGVRASALYPVTEKTNRIIVIRHEKV